MQHTSTERMRMENARSILSLVHEEKLLYRKTLATKTRLASQTITNIVTLLVDNNVLKESSMEIEGRGRNPVSLQINYSSFFIISIKITSELISCYVNDLTGKVCLKHDILPDNQENVLSVLIEYLEELKSKTEYKISAIVCSVKGIVDSKNTVVTESNDLRWFNINLKKEFAFFEVPVFAINDMGLMAYCEKASSEKNENHMILRIDDGVGSSFVIHQSVIGSSKMVAEVGHYQIANTEENRRCFCGKTNCLTQFISKSALENTFKTKYSNIVNLVKNGSQDAISEIKNIGSNLVSVLTNLITVLDLNKIIVTGCIVEDFGDIFLDKLKQDINENLSRWNSFNGLEKKEYLDFSFMCSQFVLEMYFSDSSTIPLLWDSIFVGANVKRNIQ